MLQDQSDILADKNSRLYALNFHASLKSLRGVAAQVCGAQQMDDLQDLQQRITMIPKVWDSMFSLKEEVTRFLRNSSNFDHDVLLLGLEPKLGGYLSQSLKVTNDILNGLDPLSGSSSSHLKSISSLMASAREHGEAAESLHLKLKLLNQSKPSLVQLQEQVQQLLLAMQQLPEQHFLSEPLDEVLKNLSAACKLKHHVDSAERTILNWQQTPHHFTVTESLSVVDKHLKQVIRLRATVAGVVQLVDARSVILSHLESFSGFFQRALSFEHRLFDFGVALSTVSPISSLLNIDEETTTVYRDLHAFYVESSFLMCDETKSESDSCPPNNTNMMLQSASLENERARLLKRLSALEQSFFEGMIFSQAYTENLSPFLETISREASALSVSAHEAYEVALALKHDSAQSFPSALATSFCKNATGTTNMQPELERSMAILCADGQNNPLVAKEIIMNSLHFVASDVYTTLQYRRVVVDAVGKELMLASQGPRTLSYIDFTSSLTQLPIESLESIWLEICSFAEHLARNGTCKCIHELTSYFLCADSTTLSDFITSAYEVDVVMNAAGLEGTPLLVALDTFFLLARSNQKAEAQTEFILTGLTRLCRIAENSTYHSQELHNAKATVQAVCWMKAVPSEIPKPKLNTSSYSFTSLIKQAATLWEDVYVVMSTDLIVEIASLEEKEIFSSTMGLQATDEFAVALRNVNRQLLKANLYNLTLAENHIKTITSQRFTPLYLGQYPTVEELRVFAIAADTAWASMIASRPLIQEDLELLAIHGLGHAAPTTLSDQIPLVCSSSLCIQMQTRAEPGQPNIFRQKYQDFSELIAYAYFNEDGAILPKITAPGLYSGYSIRASTFFGSERVLVTLEPHGLKKLQGRASLIVVLRIKGSEGASIEKIFELSGRANEFIPFQGSVDGVTVANALLWVGSANQGKLHGFAVADIMADLESPGPSRLNVKHSIDFQLTGIRPTSVFFDPTTLRLWVGEYVLPQSAGVQSSNLGLACGFEADANGLVAVQTFATNKICLVVGEYVQGIALFRKTGIQMVALSRCITQHSGSPCKVEFHRLDCAPSLNLKQECFPHSSTTGTSTWDLTGDGNALGMSLQYAIRVPAGAKGLAFKAEDIIFGGYLLLCFASATKEAIDVYEVIRGMEDSIYIFATPFIADETLHVSKNEIYLTVMGDSVLNQPIFELSPSLPRHHSSASCASSESRIWGTTGILTHWEHQICIPGTPLCIGLSIGASWEASLDMKSEICLAGFNVSAALVPSVRLEFDGKAFLSLIVVRGGVGVTATILNTRIIPAVSLSLFPSRQRLPGIFFTTKLEIIPLAVEVYAYAEHITLKLCLGFIPCGFKYRKFLKLTLVSWSMRASIIEGPGHDVPFVDSTPPISGSVVAFQTSLSTVNIDWLGFSEEESEIFSYLVCIGSDVDDSDFMPCLDIGLSTSFQGRNLLIPHGAVVVVTIRYISPRLHLCSFKYNCPWSLRKKISF